MKRLVLVVVALALLAVPLTASAATGVTYTAGFQLQNLSGSPAMVVIDFYQQDGTPPSATSSVNDTIPANSSKTYFPLNTVPAGFNGSAVISSDQQLASITNVLGNNGQRGDSYAGFTAGANILNVPLLFKNSYGNDTWFNVQNTGSATATVTIAYKASNSATTCSEGPVTIPANASKTFDQSANGCLPAGFIGAATITSDQPVAGVVMEVLPKGLTAYTGFTGTSTAPTMPLVASNNFGNFTGIQIQNTGAAATTVTVSYTPSQAGTACTEAKNIPAGTSATFGYPMPAACGAKFVGSAKVTGNTGSMGLVAIVNQVNTGNANASSYNAFDPDPAKITSKVSMPLIFDRNFGWYTGISIVNVGTQPTSVSCSFSGTGYVVPATTVNPGAALVDVQNNKIAAGYVGSGVCTATGGDAKIAAIVNEVKSAAATDDVLFTYPGFNY